MGLRILVLACKRLSLSIAALWVIALPHIRPQVTSQQQRQYQQFQQFQQRQQQIEDPQAAWTTSYWDLGQNIKIDQINQHLEKATDPNIEKLRDQNMSLARELSDTEGRESVWFGLLSAGLVGALSFSFSNFLKINKGDKS